MTLPCLYSLRFSFFVCLVLFFTASISFSTRFEIWDEKESKYTNSPLRCLQIGIKNFNGPFTVYRIKIDDLNFDIQVIMRNSVLHDKTTERSESGEYIFRPQKTCIGVPTDSGYSYTEVLQTNNNLFIANHMMKMLLDYEYITPQIRLGSPSEMSLQTKSELIVLSGTLQKFDVTQSLKN